MKKHFIKLEDSIQTSLRMGKITINRMHGDYFNLNITSILFGGYFGSRLMKNIREDKGYTYGIHASNNSLPLCGFFSISAEAHFDSVDKAVDEVFKEMEILRTQLVEDSELLRVKNRITGMMLKAFDGPFALADTLFSLLEYKIDFEYYDRFFDTLQNITPEIIMQTARKYFNEESMYVVKAGA